MNLTHLSALNTKMSIFVYKVTRLYTSTVNAIKLSPASSKFSLGQLAVTKIKFAIYLLGNE